MRTINATLLAFVFLACACSSDKTLLPDGIERIPVEVDHVTQDVSSFLKKIEIIPLETNDSSLLYRYDKMVYDDSMDMYAIYINRQIVYTFAGDGKFIDNSKRREGQGPEEYNFVLDISFNPYWGGVDLLNPYGTIYTYSPTFELLDKKKVELEFPVSRALALDSVNYIFTHPDLWANQELTFVNFDTRQIENTTYDGTISGNSLGRSCFFRVGKDFYFIPQEVNYFVYKIDPVQKTLTPVIYLDFGNATIREEGLPGRSNGKRTDNDTERRMISKELQERAEYVMESDYIQPVTKFLNNNYVYICMIKEYQVYGHFIYNRQTKKGFLLKDDGGTFNMQKCFGITKDNALMALTTPGLINKHVSKTFMSPEEIAEMEALTEDDNPVVVKYYLK